MTGLRQLAAAGAHYAGGLVRQVENRLPAGILHCMPGAPGVRGQPAGAAVQHEHRRGRGMDARHFPGRRGVAHGVERPELLLPVPQAHSLIFLLARLAPRGLAARLTHTLEPLPPFSLKMKIIILVLFAFIAGLASGKEAPKENIYPVVSHSVGGIGPAACVWTPDGTFWVTCQFDDVVDEILYNSLSWEIKSAPGFLHRLGEAELPPSVYFVGVLKQNRTLATSAPYSG